MTEKLRDLMVQAAQGEEQRYNLTHPTADKVAFARAIGPRRLARRGLESAATLALVGALGFGAFALADPGRDEGPAEPHPTASAAPTSGPSAPLATTARVALAREGLPIRDEYDVPGLLDVFGIDPEAAPSCASLDARGRLGGAEGLIGTALTVGAVDDLDGAGVLGLSVASFESPAAAESYLAAAANEASLCTAELQGTGIALTASEVGVTALPGSGLRVDATGPGAEAGAWRLWVHKTGTEIAAVVAEPGNAASASALLVDWFTLDDG